MPVKQRKPADFPVCRVFCGEPAPAAGKCSAPYFGRTLGSPPGLPGGGSTGVRPSLGASFCISGSIFDGGHMMPSDCANLSLKGSRDCPVVCPGGAPFPCSAAFGG